MVILEREGITTRLYIHAEMLYADSEKKISVDNYLKYSQSLPLNRAVPRYFLRGDNLNSFCHLRGLYRYAHQQNIDAMNATLMEMGPS